MKPVYEELKQRKILVRYFDAPGLRDCLRITVGTPKEVQALLKELAALRSLEFGKSATYVGMKGVLPWVQI